MKTKKQYQEMSKFIINQFQSSKRIENVDIIIMNANKKEKPLADFKSADIDKYVKIKIFQNIVKMVKDSPDTYTNITGVSNNYLKYIVGDNALENNDALFVYILLHELGHLSHRSIYKNRFGIDEKQVQRSRSQECIKFTKLSNIDNFKEYKQHYCYDEIFANNFAHKYFPRIWYKLKENNFINRGFY